MGEWSTYCQNSGHQPHDKDSLKGVENHPVRFVTWNEALTYCRYYGFTLPSEAEWETARGIDGRIYPWGDEWKSDCSNTGEFWGLIRPRPASTNT